MSFCRAAGWLGKLRPVGPVSPSSVSSFAMSSRSNSSGTASAFSSCSVRPPPPVRVNRVLRSQSTIHNLSHTHYPLNACVVERRCGIAPPLCLSECVRGCGRRACGCARVCVGRQDFVFTQQTNRSSVQAWVFTQEKTHSSVRYTSEGQQILVFFAAVATDHKLERVFRNSGGLYDSFCFLGTSVLSVTWFVASHHLTSMCVGRLPSSHNVPVVF